MSRLRLAALVFVAALIALVPSSSPGQAKGPKPLKILGYASLFPGVDHDRAKEATRPVCDLVGERVGYPIQVDVRAGNSAKDLREFGAKLANPYDDTVHLAGLWGLEYGWLLKDHDDLEPLVLFLHGDKKENLHCILVVRKDKGFQSLKDLRGKNLVRYDGASLMVDLALAEIFKKERLPRENFFAPEKKKLASAKEALFAVRSGHADCAMVTERDMMRLAALQPTVRESLVTLKESDTFPLAGLIGSRKKINSLKPGLWEALTREFPKVNETREGARCLRFWRFHEFSKPYADYRQDVITRAADLPIGVLADRK
jgi:ABC-type phosphate/phosphonate transport system substrate-binding protein